jgi:TrmH family RNA methyltransferase
MPTPPPLRIDSPANPRVKSVLRLRKSRERRRQGLLLAEGRREVSRAFAAGLVCRQLWVEERRASEVPIEWAGRSEQVLAASREVMRKISWHEDPEGWLGVFVAPTWSLEQLPAPTVDTMYLVAVGIEKPGNLGAMVRSAAAAGCSAVLTVASSVDTFNPAAIRNSTAAVFALPVVPVESGATARGWLRERKVFTLAAVAPEQGGDDVFARDWPVPVAVVVGAEATGLDAAWRKEADARVTIPMAEKLSTQPAVVDSLNASTAAAVLLFEARRRRPWRR